MDVFDETFINFWKALNENNVRYIMAGGFATNFHGYQRTTDDIDIQESIILCWKPCNLFPVGRLLF